MLGGQQTWAQETTVNAIVPTTPASVPLDSGARSTERAIKEQVVLVLQGGGALGAYQAGVYQALMEGGVEPDWVIGTSIGAINGALIAGSRRSTERPHTMAQGLSAETPASMASTGSESQYVVSQSQMHRPALTASSAACGRAAVHAIKGPP